MGKNKRDKPSAKRRVVNRPDLFHKARNVARSGGDLSVWAEAAKKRGEPGHIVSRAAEEAK